MVMDGLEHIVFGEQLVDVVTRVWGKSIFIRYQQYK